MPHDYKRVLRERAEEEALAAASRRDGRAQRPLDAVGEPGLMGKLGGFLQIERHGVPYRDPLERAHDYREFLLTRPVPELRDQGARCMDCGVPVLPQRLPARAT